jgi:co-chaperonin GroES (HSP10)
MKLVPESLNEKLVLPIKIGDTILMGRFKNKKVKIKRFGKDEHGVPTINGKKALTFRYYKPTKKDKEEMKANKINEVKSSFWSLSDKEIQDLLVTALEGGSNYWYFLDRDAAQIYSKYGGAKGTTPVVDRIFLAIKAGESIPIRDTEDEEEILGYINTASIKKGTKLFQQEYPQNYVNVKKEEYDVEDADIWFQLVVLGELTFG